MYDEFSIEIIVYMSLDSIKIKLINSYSLILMNYIPLFPLHNQHIIDLQEDLRVFVIQCSFLIQHFIELHA